MEEIFVRCRLVARDFKPPPRHDLFVATPPLEAMKALFAFLGGVRERRRERGLVEAKLMFVDVMETHFNPRCDEEEWVELPDELEEHESCDNEGDGRTS